MLALNVWLAFYDSVHLFFIPNASLLSIPWRVNKVYKKEAVCKISDSTQTVIGFHFGPFRFFPVLEGPHKQLAALLSSLSVVAL